MAVRTVTVRLTLAQALAAANACDLIRDAHDADGRKRDAALYERACTAISRAIGARAEKED